MKRLLLNSLIKSFTRTCVRRRVWWAFWCSFGVGRRRYDSRKLLSDSELSSGSRSKFKLQISSLLGTTERRRSSINQRKVIPCLLMFNQKLQMKISCTSLRRWQNFSNSRFRDQHANGKVSADGKLTFKRLLNASSTTLMSSVAILWMQL